MLLHPRLPRHPTTGSPFHPQKHTLDLRKTHWHTADPTLNGFYALNTAEMISSFRHQQALILEFHQEHHCCTPLFRPSMSLLMISDLIGSQLTRFKSARCPGADPSPPPARQLLVVSLTPRLGSHTKTEASRGVFRSCQRDLLPSGLMLTSDC